MKLSKGNNKMNRGFLIWNITEKVSCPGSTPFCRKHCYACKASTMYPSVRPSRLANFMDSKADTFSAEMITLIHKTIKGYKSFNGYFRIHEAGDFYSQAYLDAWKTIARQFPKVKFLAFTKSFMLDFKGTPKNLTILSSIMPDSTLTPIKGFPKAYAGNCKDMVNTIECPGLCDSCGMCWNLPSIKKNVHFNIH